jgi:hypothetical protein
MSNDPAGPAPHGYMMTLAVVLAALTLAGFGIFVWVVDMGIMGAVS